MEPRGDVFILLDGARHWQLPATAEVTSRGAISLAATAQLADLPDDAAAARVAAAGPGRCGDAHGSWAGISDDGSTLWVASPGKPPLSLLVVEGGEQLLDCAVSEAGWLGVIVRRADASHELHIIDLRETYPPTAVACPAAVDRIAAARLGCGGGFWLVVSGDGQLFRLQGRPPLIGPERALPTGRLRADDAPTWQVQAIRAAAQPVRCVSSLSAAGLGYAAASDALLLVQEDGSMQVSGLQGDGQRWQLPAGLEVFSCAHVSADRVALLRLGQSSATVVELRADLAEALPRGELYPMPGWDGERLLAEAALAPGPARYLREDGNGARLQELRPLARRRSAEEAVLDIQQALDAGRADAIWHRVVIDADLPPGTSLTLRIAVADDPLAQTQWHDHHFNAEQHVADGPSWTRQAHASWQPESERPFVAPSCLGPPIVNRRGSWNVLLQANDQRVRRLQGRYARLQLILRGDGQSVPTITQLRCYPFRPRWRDRYLPEYFGETLSGAAAQEAGAATGADFQDRYLSLFESILTPIELRVRESWRVTDPLAAPAQALPWIASWLGQSLPPGIDTDSARRYLEYLPSLYRYRGTLRGLNGLLDALTDRWVSRGKVVVVEDFRLRRSLATVLGIQPNDETDPLTLGAVARGHSTVGRHLILGDEREAELQAIFLGDEAELTLAELNDRLANRVTVLVHQATDDGQLAAIRHVAEDGAPAHVAIRVVAATEPLLVGVTSLLGIDTSIGEHRAADPVVVGDTTVGHGDRVRAAALLDERMDG